MIWMIGILFALAVAAPLLHPLLGRRLAFLVALAPAGIAAQIIGRLPLDTRSTWMESYPWISDWGIALSFRLDGLSATFAILICAIGTLVLVYSASYMRDDPRLGRLCGFLLLFMGAMLGVVLSDDLFALFVFWELTSLASYLLIGFKHEKQEAREAARQALLVTGAGGLALLAGFVLLSVAAGQSGLEVGEISRISVLSSVDLSGHGLFVPALLLIVLGAFSKSAQMPLHFWLPNAMTAPTPVSAYLHSATMVKAGVFLLARLNPVFGESIVWHVVLTSAGAVTMLLAATMAVGQTDLKKILAYTTVSVLGTLTMLIGVGTDLAIKAAVVYLVAHACYKAALFLIAGTLEHATGTRDVRQLGGLAGAMPVTAVCGLLAALSMAGAPPLFGFVGKELLLKAKLDLEFLGVVLIFVASLANVFLIAMALVVAVWPFFRRRGEFVSSVGEAPFAMLVGPLILSVTGLFVGLLPGVFDWALGSAMATAVGGRPIEMELKLWHGFSPVALTALAISLVTLSAGFVVFLRFGNLLGRTTDLVNRLGVRGPARMYGLLYAGLLTGAERITRMTEGGSLRQYIRVVLVTLVLVCVYPLARSLGVTDGVFGDWYWHELLLILLIPVGALAAVLCKSRMSAIAQLGIAGFLIAVLFALFSAPDLAITQVLVEALTVILLVLIFYRLPEFKVSRGRSARVIDAVIALAAGGVMVGMVMATATLRLPASVSQRLSQLSRPEAYGDNVVNVILVDFRALDTLGEITVVAVAALGAYAMVKMYRQSKSAGGER